jgi:antitoxin (DNA-binding transcriptional repressor) of toxin-antitoxin stability system
VTTVSVSDLRHNFPSIEKLLREGEEIQIAKHRKVIACLVAEKTERPSLPDFLGRIRAIYGDKVLEVSGADLICMDRDRL